MPGLIGGRSESEMNMTSIREAIRRMFAQIEPLPAGTYHYMSPPSDPNNYRLHLRLEPDGAGLLIVNASTILHLNRTAAEYAFYLVQNLPEQQAINNIVKRYRVSRAQAFQDYRDFHDRIETLISTPDLDPVTFLDFDRQTPFSGAVSAPYRLDCALTYRLPDVETPSAAPLDRVTRELSTEEWKAVIDKAWTAGIPHVVFTGGEPTLRPDLAELIAHAESNDQVTGLISDGLALAEKDALDRLLQTGLDHMMIVLRSEDERSWKALQNALDADLFVAVHLTITPESRDFIAGLLDRLSGMGVKAISLSASDPSLAAVVDEAREKAANLHFELVWNLPVPYSAVNPVSLELEDQEQPDGAGRAWLYVEPDGDTLPAQGVNVVLGNMLTDPWDKIWKTG
ncbi:MAG: radical SAM protein [Chloroflexota bacterium]|nr:MAG: radical SAM protein [Chloroflexota bacterium]